MAIKENAHFTTDFYLNETNKYSQPVFTCSKLTIKTPRCEICSNLTIKSTSSVFIVNFEHGMLISKTSSRHV